MIAFLFCVRETFIDRLYNSWNYQFLFLPLICDINTNCTSNMTKPFLSLCKMYIEKVKPWTLIILWRIFYGITLYTYSIYKVIGFIPCRFKPNVQTLQASNTKYLKDDAAVLYLEHNKQKALNFSWLDPINKGLHIYILEPYT